MERISLLNVSKKYSPADAAYAVYNVSLTIPDGEFVTVLGPSGCGKSTLLELVAGLSEPTAGAVCVNGHCIDGPSPDVGVVFQDPALFPWRTIRSNVGLGLELHGVAQAKRQELSDKYMRMVHLAGWEDKYPHELSGGMRQRAGLVRTLVNNPSILLMDEPLGAVDYLTRLSIQDEIISLWQTEKKTVLFITHDVGEAVYLGTKVVLMTANPGQISEIIEVPFAYPRDRNDPALSTMVKEILHKINRDAMNAPTMVCE